MIVIVLENAPPHLRGRLSLWLTEVRAGTYVGVYSKRQRVRIWDEVTTLIGAGSAVMMWSSPSAESGFAFEAIGPDRRACIDLDGMTLVRFVPPAARGSTQQSIRSGGGG